MKALVLFLCSLALSAQTVWFEPNVGQVKGQTEWVGRSKGAYLYITGNEVVYANKTNVHMRLFGASKHARVEGLEPTGGYSNYFTGRDEKTWFTGIQHYARLRYKDVYPGIDLAYYGSGRNAEYDFIVKPGGNPDRIELAFSEPVQLDHGDIIVAGMRQHRPRVIQEGGVIDADYVLGSEGRVQLALGRYDRTRELTIDPVLEFSTLLGGPGDDTANGIVLDSAGNIFVAMSTQSPATPTLNPFQQTNIVGLQPAVFKFGPDGKQLLYYSVIGSGGWDPAHSIALDSNGSPIITGTTESANFPLKNPIQTQLTARLWSAFMTKLSPDGRSLVYSTYLGGSGRDDSWAVAVDGQGNAYFGGETDSRDFPIKNAVQPIYGGGDDCFLAKITPSGGLAFSTYYGGSGREFCHAVSLTPDGGVLLGGSSNSVDFPFKNAIQTQFTSRGLYNTPALMKFTSDGQTVVFATYYGGPVAGDTFGVATDVSGNIYVTGYVDDSNFQVKNAYQSSPVSSTSAFLAKFDANMKNTIYATYLGGTGYTTAQAIAVDLNGSAYIAGQAGGADFPTKNSLQKFIGGGVDNVDGFIAKFDPSGSALVYSTFLGGSGEEGPNNIALDTEGNAYIVGWTLSVNFPIKNAFQPVYGGGGDGFLTKISDSSPISQSPLTTVPRRVAFQYVQGGSLPSPQSLLVAGASFTASTADLWLATTSTTSGNLIISVQPSSLGPGTYNGSVRLTPPVGTAAIVDVTLLVLGPAPLLASVEPPTVPVGSDDTTITIHGSGFTTNSIVQVDGLPWMTTPVRLVNASTLVFSMPAAYFLDAYTHTVAVQNPEAALSAVLSISVGVPAPSFTSASVVNAGSFASGPVTPGEIVTIFGTNLGGNVTFDRIPATIVYSSATQISATVPYSVLGPKTALQVGLSVPVSLDVASSAPGIFAAVSNADGTLTLYATGCGALTRDALPLCQLPVSATINGEPAPVLYAGIAPGLVEGANQINIALPSDIGSGQTTIVVTAGNASSKPFSFTLP